MSDGGVIYTRKFYDQVVREGAGSPLLFPETVYNAPGSHVAALLGLDGITYTLVGDASAGLAALELGAQLVASGEVDHCLVAGAEEADWVLCEAYRRWRLSALTADGAAAVVLGREGRYRLHAMSSGVPFFRQSEAGASLAAALRQLPRPAAARASSAARMGHSWTGPSARRSPDRRPRFSRKASLGDAFGASALMQVICAVRSLRDDPEGAVLVPVIGLNHQAAAALITTR